jgi:hypothetical protein
MWNWRIKTGFKQFPTFGEQLKKSKTTKVRRKIFAYFNFGLKPHHFKPNQHQHQPKQVQSITQLKKGSYTNISVEKPWAAIKIKSIPDAVIKKVSGAKEHF